jgi:hypothetical protein
MTPVLGNVIKTNRTGGVMRFNLLNSGAILLVLTCSDINTANAADLEPGWYGVVGIGASWLDPDTGDTFYSVGDDQDFSWQLSGGYRINQNFSVELAFADLGGAEIISSGTVVGDLQYRQTSLSVLWSPTMKPDLTWRYYLKAGINYSDPSWDNDPLIVDDLGALAGIGIEKFFGDNNFALRAEYTAYAEDAQVLNLSMVVYFSD